MKIIRTIKQMQKFSKIARQKGQRIGFVPTMGCLHEGHLSLIRKCREENDICILSIFVNPTQFGPKEDFQKYPREKKNDELFAKQEKVDIIFYPSEKEMYPTSYLTYVSVDKITKGLCGQMRPGHFRGVTTIVAKLLNSVLPDVLYLGRKDAQQAVVLGQMVNDLNWAVHVKVLPIVRAKDGLALSSRNRYLSAQERQQSLCLYRSLKLAKRLIQKKEKRSFVIKHKMSQLILKNPKATIDYIACVNAQTLDPLKTLQGKTLIALAVFIGKTRLIDNIVVNA